MDPLMRLLVNAVYTYWTTFSRRPVASDLIAAKFVPLKIENFKDPEDEWNPTIDLTPQLIQSYLITDEFAKFIMARGVPWLEYEGLTTEQHYCLQLLSDPTDRRSLQLRLKDMSVPYAKYRAWMDEPTFRAVAERLSDRILGDTMSATHTGLTRAAERGDLNAIKFIYEITGKYDPAEKMRLDVQQVLIGVVEIIQNHVSDPETLLKIAADIKLLMAANVPDSGSKELLNAGHQPQTAISGSFRF